MAPFLFFRSAKRPPISTGATLMPRALPPDSDGSMTAMAKGVNDVLNYYVQVTDTKASIFIAGSVAAASFLLLHFPDGLGARLLYFSAAFCLGASLILATLVILPRLPARSGSGSVYWGHIADFDDPGSYHDSFAKAAAGGLLDEEYSRLNYYTARILATKIRILQFVILFFLAGVLTALPHHLMNR